MRTLQTALLAGIAAVAIGSGGAAFAQSPQMHVMTVRLPGGGIEQIEYTGKVPPQVDVTSMPATVSPMPMPVLCGGEPPFAIMDRISAEMDREADTMFRQTAALAAAVRAGQFPVQVPGGLTEAAMGSVPPGSESFSYISTMSGSGVCTQSVQITASGNGGPPRVVSHSTGNCGAAGIAPDLLWTKADGPRPYAGLVHVADLPR